MRKTITVTAMVIAVAMGTMAAAFAQQTIWDDDAVLDSDSQTTEVVFVAQAASIDLDGPVGLDVGETGGYTVAVKNESLDRDLDNFLIGFGVDNIEDLNDLTITRRNDTRDYTSDADAPDGTVVEIVDNVVYFTVQDFSEGNDLVQIGLTREYYFDVTFHKEGSFTGTAYVIDLD